MGICTMCWRTCRRLSRAFVVLVLAAPARPDELTLGRRRRDLGVLVLFMALILNILFW